MAFAHVNVSADAGAATIDIATLQGVTVAFPTVLGAPFRWATVISVPRSQAYFWTPVWQAAEAEADADIAAGRVERFASMREAIVALRSKDD